MSDETSTDLLQKDYIYENMKLKLPNLKNPLMKEEVALEQVNNGFVKNYSF